MGTLAHTIARKDNSTLFAFILRESDGAVYNNVTQQFIEGLNLHLTLDEQSRLPFRVPYAPLRSGAYRVEVDCTNFIDGSYTIQSRFLDQGQESIPTEITSVFLESGEVKDGTLNMSANLPSGLNVFCFIKNVYTGKYLKNDMSDFLGLSLMDESEDLRAGFRHSFTEIAPGEYLLNRSLSNVPDTVLLVTVYYLRNNLEYKIGLPITVHVANGKHQRGILFDTVMVNHDILEFDKLRYLAPNGEPIDGAQVYIFKKSEYSADRFDNALGRTITRSDGRWISAIPVQAGDTYVVVLHKDSEYGPNTIDIAL
jgi:hypothetical protein